MSMYQATNEDFVHSVVWRPEDGTPFPLSSVTFTAKDENDTIVLQATEADHWNVDGAGIWTMTIPMAIMGTVPVGDYRYDIVVVRTTDSRVKSLQYGKLYVREGIT